VTSSPQTEPATPPKASDAKAKGAKAKGAKASQTSASMRAIVQDAYGSTEVLQMAEIDRPVIAANEVLVKVVAAGMDRGTAHVMAGTPYLMRVLGFGFRRPKNRVPGLDVAGIVEAVGSEVTRFAPGDEVFGMSRGAYAEFAPVLEKKLAHKPASLTFEQAAVVPISGGTALQALNKAGSGKAGSIKAGDKVLIIGASGGVGTYAVQLAKAFGAEVTGVASAAKLDLVRSIGADHVVDYAGGDYLDGSKRYDFIIDIAGNNSLPRLCKAMTPTGALVIVGGEEGGSVTGGFGRSLRAPLVSMFVSQRLTMLASKEQFEDLEMLTKFIEQGRVSPIIAKTFPLAQVPEAIRHLEAGHVRGKIAITI
jgi:NADPH:quinone reductase-like Zn-dependent oxidoreductase